MQHEKNDKSRDLLMKSDLNLFQKDEAVFVNYCSLVLVKVSVREKSIDIPLNYCFGGYYCFYLNELHVWQIC